MSNSDITTADQIPNDETAEQLLTVREAAGILRITPRAVLRVIARGSLQARIHPRPDGRGNGIMYLIPLSAINERIAKRDSVSPTSVPVVRIYGYGKTKGRMFSFEHFDKWGRETGCGMWSIGNYAISVFRYHRQQRPSVPLKRIYLITKLIVARDVAPALLNEYEAQYPSLASFARKVINLSL